MNGESGEQADPRINRRIDDILHRIERISIAERQLVAADAAGDSATGDTALDAILYDLVVIGEAVRTLPDELTRSEPDIPWQDVVDMRNFLAHEYHRVSTDVVRKTIDAPLDDLRAACIRIQERSAPHA